MPDGSLLRPRIARKKTAAGYDLTRLLIGSEGTLGIITELTLRLQGIPQAISAAVCAFPCRLRLQHRDRDDPVRHPGGADRAADALQVKACNMHSHLDLPESPALFLEFHGSRPAWRSRRRSSGRSRRKSAATVFAGRRARRIARSSGRRGTTPIAARELRPGVDIFATDVCVPISRLAECVGETQADLARLQLLAPIVGHAGDGNFHVERPRRYGRFDRDEGRRGASRPARRRAPSPWTAPARASTGSARARSSFSKASSVRRLARMRAIKSAIDPLNIMNPGKIFAL